MLHRERNYKEWKRVQNKHKSVMNLVTEKQRRIVTVFSKEQRARVSKRTIDITDRENYLKSYVSFS